MVKDSENAPNACIATEAPRLVRQPREVPPPTLRSRAGSRGGQNEVVLVASVSSTGHVRDQYWLLSSTSTGSQTTLQSFLPSLYNGRCSEAHQQKGRTH